MISGDIRSRPIPPLIWADLSADLGWSHTSSRLFSWLIMPDLGLSQLVSRLTMPNLGYDLEADHALMAAESRLISRESLADLGDNHASSQLISYLISADLG